VGLDPVERARAGDLRAPEGVGDDLADVREDVGPPLAAVELGLQGKPGRAVPQPAIRADGFPLSRSAL
jgi:hypothetical protein